MACNSTLDNLPDDSWNNVLGVLMCIITVTAAIENLAVLLLLLKYKILRTPSNKILASLAMADFLTGSLVAPLHAAQYLNKDILHNCTVELVRRYLSTVLIGASAFSLGFISYDRSLHLIRLQKYKMKKSVMYLMLIICWLVPILLPFLRFINDTEQVYSATIITIGAVMLIIIISSYSALIFALKRYTGKSKDGVRQHSEENERRAGVTVMIIVTCYLLMLVPVYIHHGLNSSKRFDKVFLAKSYNITMLLAIANSSVNPLIYCYRTDVLKRYIHRFVTAVFRRSVERTGSVPTEESRI